MPAGTRLDGISVPVSRNGTAEVPLSDEVLDVDDRQLNLLFAQVAWTLRQISGVRRVAGSPWTATPVGLRRVARARRRRRLVGVRPGRGLGLLQPLRPARRAGGALTGDGGAEAVSGPSVAWPSDCGRSRSTCWPSAPPACAPAADRSWRPTATASRAGRRRCADVRSGLRRHRRAAPRLRPATGSCGWSTGPRAARGSWWSAPAWPGPWTCPAVTGGAGACASCCRGTGRGW